MGVNLRQLKVLIFRMTWREITLRYKGSILGLLWSFILPLLTVALYTFLFSYVFKAKWNEQDSGLSNYAVILFSGLILHNFLSDVLIRSCTVVRAQSNLVKKVVFPLHVLPAVVVFSASFQMLVSLFVLTAMQLFLGGQLTIAALALPFLLMPLIFFGLGAAWIISVLGVYLEDLGQVIGLASTALMFSAPILYPIKALPEFIHPWLYLNPLTFLVEQLRIVLLFGGIPNWFGLLIYYLVSMSVLAIGWWLFDRTKKGFADVL